MHLNPQQEQVANHVEGRILTLAGPGSGKTRTITERTGRLIRRNIHPSSILCLTFTNKARDEMRQRIAAEHGEMAAKVFISNFHGLCGVILRRLGQPLGYSERLTVLDTDDQADLLLQLARKKGMEPTKPQARLWALIVNDWRENLGDEAALEAATDGRLKAREVAVLRAYVETLRSRNQTDFSGLLAETVRLLRGHADVREKLQKRFRFIQVDEYQDTNRAQNEIVELLCGAEDNLLAVGDGDQSIYEWRGASPDGIPRFIANGEKKTGRCAVVKLGLNYRSTPQIIETADRLIRHCANRIPVEFATNNPAGELAKCAKMKNPEEEADAIAGGIHKLIQAATPAREIAVFYRTNDMSRPIEQALAKRQIPYIVVGSGSYYDRMEVKDVISMLRFVCNPRDGIAFARIANKPARGLGDALLGKLETFAEGHSCSLLDAMRFSESIRDDNEKPLPDAALRACRDGVRIFDVDPTGRSVLEVTRQLLGNTRYEDWLKDKYEEKDEFDARRQNVQELVNSIADFCRSSPRATIADYLQSISLYTEAEAVQDNNAVRLMSLHASKGLEFDVVYMVGVEHNILPHEKAVKDRGQAGLEEERRLCYVGITRARKILRITWCAQRQDTFSRGKGAKYRNSIPSKFLYEAGLMSVEEYQAAVAEARTGSAAPGR
jgi:DNA helicase-2/ATP-dependent DNA helicase PcrA